MLQCALLCISFCFSMFLIRIPFVSRNISAFCFYIPLLVVICLYKQSRFTEFSNPFRKKILDFRDFFQLFNIPTAVVRWIFPQTLDRLSKLYHNLTEKNYEFHERAFFCHKSSLQLFSDNSSSTEKHVLIPFMKKPPFQDGIKKGF